MAIDLNKICRLCLKSVKSDKELIEIFNNNESCSLPIRILACSTLEVKQSDSLPKSMCKECRYDLEKSYLFQIKSKNADTKLRRHLRLINSGEVSNVFQEQDDDEYKESIAFLAKWETEQVTKPTVQNNLNQSQVQRFDVHNSFPELIIKYGQNIMDDCKDKEYTTTLMVEELPSDYYENYEMLDDVTNLQLANSGKVSNVFQEEEGEECEESIAFLAKWETEQITKPTAQNNLNQSPVQRFDLDNSLLELLIKPGPNLECNQMDDCDSTEIENKEHSTTLMVEELSSDYYEDYEMLDDVTNNYPSMYDTQKEPENAHITEREQSHFILSGNEQIEISLVEPETESDTQKEDAEYANTEYLELDEEDVGDDDKIIPGEFPYREGVDCKIYRKIDILESDNSIKTFYSTATAVPEKPISKLYKCKQCSKAFQHASGLSRHSAVHAGRKFECGICSKLFSDSSSKKRHETWFHNRNRM